MNKYDENQFTKNYTFKGIRKISVIFFRDLFPLFYQIILNAVI